MARELMIDRAYLSQIENGKREPSTRLQATLMELARNAKVIGPQQSIPARYEEPASGNDNTSSLREEEVTTQEQIVNALEDLCIAYRSALPERRPVILTQIRIVAGSLGVLSK